MTQRTRFASALGLAATAFVLTACGGDDSSAPSASATKAEGVYQGTLTGSASTDFQLLVLEDDEYWSLYGSQVGNGFAVSGFIQGQGASDNGSFTSSNARDFGTVPPTDGTVAASYVVNASISGSVVSTSATVMFSGTPIPATRYDYNRPALVSEIAGAWLLTALDGSPVSMTVAADGRFNASTISACTIRGTLTPRSSGKNVFDLSLTYGSLPCAVPNATATGVALTYPTASGAQQIVIAAINQGRTEGTALFGTR